jgi:hypothetical protein
VLVLGEDHPPGQTAVALLHPARLSGGHGAPGAARAAPACVGAPRPRSVGGRCQPDECVRGFTSRYRTVHPAYGREVGPVLLPSTVPIDVQGEAGVGKKPCQAVPGQGLVKPMGGCPATVEQTV